MQIAPLAQLNANDDRHCGGSLRQPQVAGDLLSLIQMLHERVELLERNNHELRQKIGVLEAECVLAAEFRLLAHERMRM